MARTKVYTQADLDAIRASRTKWISEGSPGAFLTEGAELYILMAPGDPDRARWLHPKEGLVDLFNTHGTGELRWDVEPKYFTVADDLVAALHYGLTPADMSAEDWRAIITKHRFTMGSLPGDEQELIRRADNNGEGKIVVPPDDSGMESAVHSAMRKGLVYMAGAVHSGKTSTIFYKLTAKGRRLKAGKGNPRARTKRRARTPSAQTRARNDRLRRIMRGI